MNGSTNTNGVPLFDATGDPLVYAAGDHLRDSSGALLYHDIGDLKRHIAGNPIVGEFHAAGDPVLYRAGEPVLDENGEPRFNGTGLPRTDEYGRPLVNPDGSANTVVVETEIPDAGLDSQADHIILHGGQSAAENVHGNHLADEDRFSITNTDTQVNIVRDGVMTFNLSNSERATGDRLTIAGHDGDDALIASGLNMDLLALRLFGENQNDTIVGSPFSDLIDGGTGDDTLTGGSGVDVFQDSSGEDTLKEVFDQDISLFGDTFVVGSVLGDGGGTFNKRKILDEQDANNAAESREAFIIVRDGRASSVHPNTTLIAPVSANSQTTVQDYFTSQNAYRETYIHLIGEVVGGDYVDAASWTATITPTLPVPMVIRYRWSPSPNVWPKQSMRTPPLPTRPRIVGPNQSSMVSLTGPMFTPAIPRSKV